MGMVLRNNLASKPPSFFFLLFFGSRLSPRPYMKTSSVSGRCNRRQVKPRNKNSEPLAFTLRHEGFSQQYGKMFDDPIDHSSLSSFPSERHDVACTYTCFSLEQWDAKRDRNSIAEYQRATDERSSSFLSRAIDRSYAIIPGMRDFLHFRLYI